jgi:uncharacterized membrane protein
MRVRKLLDWRKLLIYSHRWFGIILGTVFVAWCVSGVVLMYRHRPLWDIVVVALLLGVGVSSVTSMVPACRRLARHARKLTSPAWSRVAANRFRASHSRDAVGEN